MKSSPNQLNNLILWKSADGLKVGDKIFSFRIPLAYQWRLQAMDSKSRTTLIRKAIMEYLDSHSLD